MESTKSLTEIKTELFPSLSKEQFNDLLWNATCYPCDGEETLRQLKEIVIELKKGKSVEQIIGEVEEQMYKTISSMPDELEETELINNLHKTS
jgi:hypothetical protein